MNIVSIARELKFTLPPNSESCCFYCHTRAAMDDMITQQASVLGDKAP